MSGTTVLRTPGIARNIYGLSGAPRQRHVFMVRFVPGGSAQKVWNTPDDLAYVLKHCDRPKVSFKTEELNQYNKKRLAYVSHKLEPIRMTFYDSNDGAAQDMWAAYAAYYSSDFSTSASQAYSYDITSGNYISGDGFGLNQPYAGDVTTPDAEWFFSSIEIYQFYDYGNTNMYDKYTLVNPRITSYEPDELDYENSAVCQINMAFSYENLQYSQAQVINASSTEFDIFNTVGKGFNGNPLDVPSNSSTPLSSRPSELLNSSITDVTTLINGVPPAPPAQPAAPSVDFGSSLSSYGDFNYSGVVAPTAVFQSPQFAAAAGTPSPFVANLSPNIPAPSATTGTAQYGFNQLSISLPNNPPVPKNIINF